MEYLKAWIWKEKKLAQQGKKGADPTLVKYVEELLTSMQGLINTKLVRRTKAGNFELAQLADYQVQVRQLKDKIKSYCVCRSMPASSRHECCFCEDLREFENEHKVKMDDQPNK